MPIQDGRRGPCALPGSRSAVTRPAASSGGCVCSGPSATRVSALATITLDFCKAMIAGKGRCRRRWPPAARPVCLPPARARTPLRVSPRNTSPEMKHRRQCLLPRRPVAPTTLKAKNRVQAHSRAKPTGKLAASANTTTPAQRPASGDKYSARVHAGGGEDSGLTRRCRTSSGRWSARPAVRWRTVLPCACSLNSDSCIRGRHACVGSPVEERSLAAKMATNALALNVAAQRAKAANAKGRASDARPF